MFVLLGRFWCANRPFAVISDLVQKMVGAERPVPTFLKKYGIWIIDAFFLVGLMMGASKVAGRRNGASTLANVARFGYAFIPLDVAAHIAHNLFHLLAEGKSVFSTVLVLFGGAPIEGTTAILGPGSIQLLQYFVLAIVIEATGYAVHRITRGCHGTGHRYQGTLVPMMAVVAALSILNLWLFALPMAHRM